MGVPLTSVTTAPTVMYCAIVVPCVVGADRCCEETPSLGCVGVVGVFTTSRTDGEMLPTFCELCADGTRCASPLGATPRTTPGESCPDASAAWRRSSALATGVGAGR